MATIAYNTADGSTLSRVTILKDGRALEVNPSAAAGSKKTWPSMDAWAQQLPREWPRVDVWIAATASASAASAATAPALAPAAAVPRRPVTAGPRLAYFLNLPEGATTSSREAIRAALVSYLNYRWCQVSYWKKHEVQPAHTLYRVDDFLVTLTGLDPRGNYTARQIVNAVMARQTQKVAVAPVAAALVPLEEMPSDEEIMKLTATNADLAWHNLRLLGENKRLKAEIEALQARLSTIRVAACI